MFQLFRFILARMLKKISPVAIRNSKIGRDSKVEGGSSFISSTFGNYSFCGHDCEILNTDIGSYCSIANSVVIGGAMHPISWLSTSPVFYNNRDSVKTKYSRHERNEPKRTVIGSDVWIGRSALIKQGVTIGTGAVIGMGAVVTKDVPPYAIFAGNPAKLIRYRFDDETIDKLLRSHWWALEPSVLKRLGAYSKNPLHFLLELDKLNGK